MLFDLLKICIKPIHPVKYNIGWNSVYNKKSEMKVTNHLTTTKVAISILASRSELKISMH